MNSPSSLRHLILGDGVIGQGVADGLARLGRPLALASRSGPKGGPAAGPPSPRRPATTICGWTRSTAPRCAPPCAVSRTCT